MDVLKTMAIDKKKVAHAIRSKATSERAAGREGTDRFFTRRTVFAVARSKQGARNSELSHLGLEGRSLQPEARGGARGPPKHAA